MILYNEGLIEDEYFIARHAQKAKTDKSSSLYDRKSEKKMRELLNDFIQWLQSAEYDDGKLQHYSLALTQNGIDHLWEKSKSIIVQ